MTRTRKRCIAAVFVVVMAGIWVAVAPFVADGLVVKKPLEKADAIVVLSGSAEYIDRTHEAARAFKAGVAPKILVTNDDHRSGWVESEKRNPYFVERAFAELVSQGVPANAIEALPGAVHGTDDEANLVVPFALERKMRSLVLITSPYHSCRALWTFERAVAKSSASLTLGVLTPSENYRYPTRFNWWMSIYGWRSVGIEYVKFAYYWLFY